MSKLLLLAIIGLAIVGVITGVFEVKVHIDKIGNVPVTLQQVIGGGSVLPQAEYYITVWKRKAEIAFANTDSKKFEYYMKYVEQDTKRLKETLDTKKDPEIVLMHSKLLNESLENAKASIEIISKDELQKVRDSWVRILASANVELARLSILASEYKQFQEQIEKIAPSPQATPKLELKF